MLREFISSLNLEEKLSPRKNADVIWFYIFLPALVFYFILLTDFINSKPSIGSIEIIHPSFNYLIYPGKAMEIITADLEWAEGPLWVQDDASSSNYLMFSDTVTNRIYKWEEGIGMFTVGRTIYIENSGCESNQDYCDSMYEPGSNSLQRKNSTSLDILVCQHGERAISLIRENGTRSTIATHFKGKRLNSPNDMVISLDGHLYFTDPRYGLFDKERKHIVGQEQKYSGVYMIKREHVQNALTTGESTEHVRLLDGSLDWPNGLAFSPDYSKLYVSNSDSSKPIIKVFDVADNGALRNGKLFFNATDLYIEECARLRDDTTNSEIHSTLMNASSNHCNTSIGLPDGMKVDIHGNIFATGPGGVLVLSSEGLLIGRFRLDRPVSNIAFGADGRLYFTAKDIVARVWIKTKPNRMLVK